MGTITDKKRRVPFPFSGAEEAFSECFSLELRRRFDHSRARVIRPENVQAYQHGQMWQSHYSDHPDEVSSLTEHGQGFEIPLRTIVDGDLGFLERTLTKVAAGFYETFMTGLYSTVSEGCSRSGNIVSTKGKTPAEAFLEALKAVEFGVDRNGQPELPTFHIGSDAFKALVADAECKGEDFERQVEEIKQKKMASAFEKEAQRRARFVKRDG